MGIVSGIPLDFEKNYSPWEWPDIPANLFDQEFANSKYNIQNF